MAAMTMEREHGDVSGFMDRYKFGQHQTEVHKKYGGGTSLPLSSDNLDERRNKLREERHVDWMQQQEKGLGEPAYRNPYKHSHITAGPQQPGDYDMEIQKMTNRYHNKYNDALFDADQQPHAKYYRVGTPEAGLPGIGKYEEQRKEYDKMRQKDYKSYREKQQRLEHDRVEARRRISPPRQRPQAQMDYNYSQEQARAEDKRAYQDYMENVTQQDQLDQEWNWEGKFQHPNAFAQKPPMNYEENRRVLAAERKDEYNKFMEEKQKQERELALRGKPTTPPGGLNVGQYDRQVKQEAAQKKKDYKAMLDQQKGEQLQLRAWERLVEISPGHVKAREEERPLVGSPRDINVNLQERENKDKFGKEYHSNTKNSPSYSPRSSPGGQPYEDDPTQQKYLKYEQEKREEKRKYREELLKQKQEHMYLRARQEPEVSVMERSGGGRGPPPQHSPPSHLANKPPPGPSYRPREEQGSRQTPAYWNDGRRSKGPNSYDSGGSRQYRINENYSDVPLAFRTNLDDRSDRRGHHRQPPYPGEHARENEAPPPQGRQPPSPGPPGPPPNPLELPNTPAMKGNVPLAFQTDSNPPPHPNAPSPRPQWLESDGQGQGQGQYRGDRGDQSRRLSPGQPRSDKGGAAPYDDSWIKERRREAGQERAKDYNDHVKHKKEQEKRRHEDIRRQAEMGKPAPVVKNAYYGSEEHEAYAQKQRKQLGDEYVDYLNKQYQPPPGRIGLPLGQYVYEPKRLAMEAQRNQEYNALKKKFKPSASAQGLPIGQYRYEPKRIALEAQRNAEYNQMLQTTSLTRHQDPSPPQGLNIDVEFGKKKDQALEVQRNKEYNKFLQETTASLTRHQDPTPPQGLNIDVEFGKKKDQALKVQRNKEYNKFLEETTASLTRQQDPTPPQGLNIDVEFAKRKDQALETQRNKEYNKFLQEGKDNQQMNIYANETFGKPRDAPHKEYLPRAAGNAYLPPPSPAKDAINQDASLANHQQLHGESYEDEKRMGQIQQLPVDQYFGSPGLVKSMSAPPQQPSPLPDIDQPAYGGDRYPSYQKYGKTHEQTGRVGVRPEATATTLPVGQYDELRPHFEAQRNREYNELKKDFQKKQTTRAGKKAPTPPQGLPIGQHNYDPMHKAMEQQRNEEYNEFLSRKYGASSHRSTQSEPDRSKASFYFGSDMEHDAKKKHLETERHREYNSMIKQRGPPRSRSIEVPKDSESGLPIGQQHHEAWKRFLRDQRNHEYNQMMDMKNQTSPRRGWNYEEKGMLELRGDDAIQSKQRELRAERQKEYNESLKKIKAPPNHKWPEPEDRGALLVKKGVYDNVRQMYDDQRKKEFMDTMNRRQESSKYAIGATNKPRARSEPSDARFNNPMVQSMGRYEDVRKQLVEVRKEEFQKFMSKNRDENMHRRRNSASILCAKDEDNPFTRDMGKYENEIKQQKMLERRKEFKEFDKLQKQHLTPRNTVKENIMPHEASAETPLVNYLGRYDDEKVKMLKERYKEQHEYTEKRKHDLHPPHRNFVYPTVAAAEKPIIDHLGHGIEKRKHDLQEERKLDYERYQSQQRAQEPPPRRHQYSDQPPPQQQQPSQTDQPSGPYQGGLFTNLGEHGNSRDRLNEQRKQEYQDHVQQSKQSRPTGRPNFVKDPLPNDPHGGRRHDQMVDTRYEAMLDEKRREESQRRRYDHDGGYHGQDGGRGGDGQYRQGY